MHYELTDYEWAAIKPRPTRCAASEFSFQRGEDETDADRDALLHRASAHIYPMRKPY